MLSVIMLALLGATDPLPVYELLADAARSDATYAAPGRARGAAEEALFRAVLAAAAAESPAALATLRLPARALGFRLLLGRDARDGHAAIAMLVETRRRGAGAYVIRLGPARDALVQAPHSLSDKGTLAIALAVYRSLDARALAVNSLHRKKGGDVAHDGRSTFQRMTVCFLNRSPAATVVQIHGFADASAPHDVILSAGIGSAAPAWLTSATRQLAGALPGARVAAFPSDVSVLGGTSNAQGRVTRRRGARFVHLELSGSLRQELQGAAARKRFAAALSVVLAD